MGLYIPGVKIPAVCNECKVFEAVGCYLFRNVRFLKERHPDCPLVEIPTPHGRLIDADDTIERLYMCEIDGRPLHCTSYGEITDTVDSMPVVVEAEDDRCCQEENLK